MGLRESEELFRAIFSQAAVGITQCSVTGEWLLMNDRFCEMIGYTQAELRGKTVFDITHPDDREACVAGVNQLLAGGIPSYQPEKRYLRKDGAVIWVRVYVTPVSGTDKRAQYFIGVVEDITEKVQAEAALRESEERFRNMADTAPVMVWISDLDKRCTFFNKPWLDFTGRTMEQELGNGWVNGMHPEEVDRCRATYYSSFDAHREFPDGVPASTRRRRIPLAPQQRDTAVPWM